MPDPDKFKPLVESGALPGTIEKTVKRKKQGPKSIFSILGYTPSGEPVYEDRRTRWPVSNLYMGVRGPGAEEAAKYGGRGDGRGGPAYDR